MAADWIKMRMGLRTHPKVVRIASALCADRYRVIGAMHAVWCLADEHTEDGKLPGYSLAALDDSIGWSGFSAAMHSIGWLQEDSQGLVLPRFEEHNGASAKRRAQEAERKRNDRKASDKNPHAKRTKSGPEKEKEKSNTPIPPSETFERFWTSWPKSPRKGARGQCEELWRKGGFDSIADQIVAHVEAMKLSIDWRKNSGEFVPAPKVYLHQKRWEGADASSTVPELKVAM